MTTGSNVLVGIAMLVGTVGIVVPVLPGLFLVWAATLLWAIEVHSTAGWVVFAIATLLYAGGVVAKYVLPGRRMKRGGNTSGLGRCLGGIRRICSSKCGRCSSWPCERFRRFLKGRRRSNPPRLGMPH